MFILVIYLTLIVLLIVAFRSASILFTFLKIQRELDESGNWPSVQGQIASSAIEKVEWYSRAGGTTYMYHPDIQYIYTVNGVQYDGNRVMFASNIGSSKQLEASNVVRNYPPNASVTIYYDPNAPAVSVVERKVTEYYKKAVNKEAIKLIFSILVFALVAYYLIAM